MGWAPEHVGRSSLWHFAAALDGYNRAHASPDDTPQAPSAEAYYAAVVGHC